MAYDEQLAERLRKSFGKRKVKFAEKRMMGGLCFMVDDKMCLGVEKEKLMVRIDPQLYEHALTRKGCAPMDFTGRPLRGFVYVHPEVLAEEEELAAWLQLALDYNPRAKSSKTKKSKSLRPAGH
jgi:TfoX/Sxy family transcriptional regulator of competence genes